jgi:hypothetical protein
LNSPRDKALSGCLVLERRACELQRRERADELRMSAVNVAFGILEEFRELVSREDVAAAAGHEIRDINSHLDNETV